MKRPEDQTNEEWLDDYRRGGKHEVPPEPPYESIPQNIRDWMEKNLADKKRREERMSR